MHTRKTTLVAAICAASLLPAATAQGSSAVLKADMQGARALGDRGITPDATRPAEESLNRQGRPIVTFPASRRGSAVRLGGGFSFTRRSVRVEFRSLRVRGSRVTGRHGGRTFDVLRLRNVRRSSRTIRHGSAVMAGEAAGYLRRRFGDRVFRSGLRFFVSGRIPRR